MGRYRVMRKLAAGGMAEVLLAKVIGAGGFEKPVALKRMLPSMAADPSFVDAFLREARLTVALQHPNIVQVHDFGAVRGQYYQVLEYVDGENLRQLLNALEANKQRLSVAEACYVVQQVAEGLAYAHGVTGADKKPLNIIHRDINPSNVMISRIGEVKLADFGIAKAADGSQGTQVGVIKGKAGYLSPEQVRGTEVDQRSDLFLMGLLLLELLSGKRLFDAPNYFQALQRIAVFNPQQLTRLPDVPEPLWAILTRLLEPDPAQRTASARVLAEELQGFLFESRLRVGNKEMAALFARAFPGRTSPLEAMASAPAQSEEIQIENAQVLSVEPAPSPRPPTAAAPPATPARPQTAQSRPPSGSPARPSTISTPRPPSGANAARPRRKLGEILLAQGKITETQLEDALKRREGRIGERLAAAGIITEMDVVRALAEQSGTPYISDEKLRAAPAPEEAIKLLTQDVATKYGAVPVKLRERKLICAMLEPLDTEALKAIKFACGVVEVQGIYATEGAIRAARDRFYRGVSDEKGQAEDWRVKMPELAPSGLTPFSDRSTGTREQHFDEAELERRMSEAATFPPPSTVAPPPPAQIPAPMPAPGMPRALTPSGGYPSLNVQLANGQITPGGGVVAAAEISAAMRLATSTALGAVKRVLLVSDRLDQLDLAARMLAGAGVQVSVSARGTAEVLLAAEKPELVVVAEDGLAQPHAVARQLASKAPDAEVRTAAIGVGLLGESQAMLRVGQLLTLALNALHASSVPGSDEGAREVPAAARLCKQLAGWLGGGRAEQERAAALVHVVAAANRVAGLPVLATPDGGSVAAVLGREGPEVQELSALASGRAPDHARPALLALMAVLAFVERAGAVVVDPDDASFAIERLVTEDALPSQAIDALRAVAYQGSGSARDAVVVVDADPASAGMLQQRLLAAGLRAVVARTGSEAAEQMRTGARALVASTVLPDTEGHLLVAAVRKQAAKSAPIIYLLAQDAAEDVTAGLDAGADDVIVKPVNAEVIAAKLRRALGGRAARA